MLRRIALALVLTSGCSLDAEGIASDPNPLDDVLDTSGSSETSTPGEDSTIADTNEPPDTTVETDTGIVADSGGDTFKADSVLPESAIDDTFVADTFVPDTFVADTFVADTFVADTFVADTFVADTFVADTFVADTFVADTFDAFMPDTADTSVADTGPETPITGILEVTRTELTGTARELTFSGADGTLDWSHWGYGGATGWNHRALGGTLISNVTSSPAALHYDMFPTTVTWIGGTPTPAVTNTQHGIYHDSSGDSLSFDAQGNTAADRTLRVYTTWQNEFTAMSGTVNVSLSDSTATPYTSAVPTPTTISGAHVIMYSIRFRPGTAAGRVVFKYTQNSWSGYIGLVAASLR